MIIKISYTAGGLVVWRDMLTVKDERPSRQNLVNGGAYRPIQTQCFHWEVGVRPCASANLLPLMPGWG